MKVLLLVMCLLSSGMGARAQDPPPLPGAQPVDSVDGQERLVVGAERTEYYYPLIRGKRLGLIVNQTSRIGPRHLVDSLLAAGMDVRVIFAPEHGFRGEADAGAHVASGVDTATGLPVRSLYGAAKRPAQAELDSLDMLLFDIQDVGARFYTYISTLHYIMEAAALYRKPLLVLDRANPNGMYVDGPVLEARHRSFVGIWPLPILHGCTIAELARMAKGQRWTAGADSLRLYTIPCTGYYRDSAYTLPVRPSPNLPTPQAVRLYASLCLLEGTPLSVGRGTDYPFEVCGGADARYGEFTFTPMSRPGAANPPLEGKLCYGQDLRQARPEHGLELAYILDLYQRSPDKGHFFNAFFTKLAGTERLRHHIERGHSQERIRRSWADDLEEYQQVRARYLMY